MRRIRMNRRASKALRALLTACALTGTLLDAVSAAQDMPVRASGRVQWIAGGSMIVALNDSPSVNLDQSRLAQDQQAGLARGERVEELTMAARTHAYRLRSIAFADGSEALTRAASPQTSEQRAVSRRLSGRCPRQTFW